MRMLHRITTAAALALAVGCGGVEGGQEMPSLDGPVEVATAQQGLYFERAAVIPTPPARCDATFIKPATEAFAPYFTSSRSGSCDWRIHKACARGDAQGLIYKPQDGVYLTWPCDTR